jgi:hypothetical protein
MVSLLFGSSNGLIGRIFVLIGSSTLLLISQHYLKPRLPIYTIQMNILPSLQRKEHQQSVLPIQFMKSRITKQWQTIMSTNIHFYNENFLHISIHAMTFDIYIEKYTTSTISTSPTKLHPSLLHVGTITDQYQHQMNDHRNATSTIVWSIPGRTNFTKQYCPLYMSLQPIITPQTSTATIMNATQLSDQKRDTIRTYYRSILHVLYQLLKHTLFNMLYNTQPQSLSLYTIPTTGVAHVRVSAMPTVKDHVTHSTNINSTIPNQLNQHSFPLGSLPFTISMICDNTINIIKLQIIGTYCTVHTIVPGWNQPISIAAQSIRDYTLTQLSIYNTTTGSVHKSKSV